MTTCMTRTRRLQLLGPALGRAECAPGLAGNGRLGAFQRTRFFFLVSYDSCEQKVGKVRELRVTFYVLF